VPTPGAGTIERIAGSDLTNPWDCNVYVVYGRDRAVLIDTGAGREPFRIPDAVDCVILTHLHADHSAGARRLGELGLPIHAHPWTAEGLAMGDEERSGLRRAREWNMYPPDQRLDPWPAVSTIGGGARLGLGECTLEVVETPGHSLGHISLVVEAAGRRSLISGDIIFPGGTISLQVQPDCSIDSIWQSIEHIRTFEPDALYAGHLEPVLAGATTHLDTALSAFRAGRVPPDHP
jgi:glyoxylase-like metal-dependent hydrolase (beta-lactamase superfamily II)